MRTANLILLTFELLCPHCQAKQEAEPGPAEGEPGRTVYTPADLAGVTEITCQEEGCKRMFRPPTTLRATAAAEQTGVEV
jgi:hypothetical protein